MTPRHLLRTLPLLAVVALCALAGAAPAALAGPDESTSFQVDAGHTGFASGGSLERPPLRERWARSLGSSTSFAVIGGGRVFVVGQRDEIRYDGTLYALDAVTGATLWSETVGAEAYVAYEDGRVFVTDATGGVRALDAASGAVLWSRALDEPFDPRPPVVAGGTVYVSMVWSVGWLTALDAASGATLWRARQIDSSLPAVDGSYVYVADDDRGATTALARADGSPAWSMTPQCFGYGERLVADGARLLGPYTRGQCGAMVDAATGLASAGLLDPSAGAALAGDLAIVRNGAALRARSLASGALEWERAAADGLGSPPLIVNETVYAGGANGTLLALDLRSGAELWRGTVGDGVAPAGVAGMAAGGGLLVVPAGGTVTALESERATRPGLDLRISSGPDGPTRSSAATLTFASGDLLAAQRCRLDGGAWLPCVAVAEYVGLAEGPHVFEVRTLDPGGAVVALATRGWSVDTTAPVARLGAVPKALDDSDSAWLWVELDERDRTAKLECRLDGLAWTACAVTSRYDGQYVEYRHIAEGPHTFAVRARDVLGNVQAQPATWSWAVDTIAPRLSISAGPADPTTATSATFAFAADEPATLRCALDGAAPAVCSSPHVVTGLHDGRHVLRVSATDPTGNVSQDLRGWAVVDEPSQTSPPETTLLSTPPALTSGQGATFTFTADESGWFDCRLDGGDWSTCSSPHRVFETLADGTHTFEVRARDLDGNLDPTPAAWTWRVDLVAPHTSAQLDPGSGPDGGYRFTFDSDDPAATFECGLDRAGWAACASGVTYAGLAPGAHEFHVRAVDAAGNRDGESPTISFSVPTTDPPPSDPPPSDPPASDPPAAEPPTDPPVAAPPATPAPATPAPAAAAPPAGGDAAPSATTRLVPRLPAVSPPATGPAATKAAARPDARSLAKLLAADVRRWLDGMSRRRMRSSKALKVRLAAAARGRVTLTITARNARGRRYTVARARSSFSAAGIRTVTLRRTKAGRRGLRHRGRLRLEIRVAVAPSRGRAAAARSSVRV